MSEPNDPFEARLRRLVGDAADDSPSPPSVEAMMSTNRPTSRGVDTRRRWVAGGTIGLVAAAVIALVVVPTGDDAVRPIDTAPSLPVVSTTAPTLETTPSSAPSEPNTTAVPSTSTPGTDAAATTPPPPTSTSPTTSTTTTSTTAPGPDAEAARTAIDLSDASVFGLTYGSEADPDQIVVDLEPSLGVPTFDTGWQPTPTSFDPNYDACFGPRFRTIWWDDFRITFGEFDDGEVRVAAWTIGDPETDTSAPLGELPDSRPPSGVAAEGVGVGASRAEVLAVVPQDGRMIGDTDEGVFVTGTIVTTFGIDDTDAVTGIGSGRLDCTADAG